MSDTPLQLCEDVNQQDFTERLVELSEHVTDGVEGVVTRGGHPLGFLQVYKKKKSYSRSPPFPGEDKLKKNKQLMNSDLCLLLRELHVVKDAEDDSEEVVPPVLLECVAVALHDLKHDSETSVRSEEGDNVCDQVEK